LHKANMLNAMSLLSRFSRWQRDAGGTRSPQPVGKAAPPPVLAAAMC
jgi:hypothetical protein